MNTVLLEPTDVLFFRDAIPMSAGQGKGAGCRMPFPRTLHEAFRASLLVATGQTVQVKSEVGRPRTAPRKGNWHDEDWPEKDRRLIVTRAFRSLRIVGPLPWHRDHGLLLPVPLDVAFDETRQRLCRLKLRRDPSVKHGEAKEAGTIQPLCLPMATTPPAKHGRLHGWWTVAQYRAYLGGDSGNASERFNPLPTDELWQSEDRIGVEINPASFAATQS